MITDQAVIVVLAATTEATNAGNNRGRYQQDTVKKEKVDNTPKKIIVRGNMTVGETAKLLQKMLLK